MAEIKPTTGDSSWFVHDRFGMFIHWGIYALPARHEWVKSREKIDDETYETYFRHFDPDLYDPRLWAQAARRAGMRYFVITTKHHDGFCLWDSDLTDYKAPNTPAGRDLLAPMVDAFRNEGLRVGFYHSLIDWHHPDFPLDWTHPLRDDEEARQREARRDVATYAAYLHGQVEELLTNYGPIDVLWFDFSYPGRDHPAGAGKGREDWQSEKLVDQVHRLQPKLILNNRLDLPGWGGLDTPEQRASDVVEDSDALVEECHTLNKSWGYHTSLDHDWKSPAMAVRMLVDAVSRGANFLLNVGPDGRGAIEPRAEALLAEVGEWMELHTDSIRGAGRSVYQAPSGCRFTQASDRLFLHLFDYPFGQVDIPGLGNTIVHAQFVHDASEVVIKGQRVPVHTEPPDAPPCEQGMLSLYLPTKRPDVLVPVVELFFD